MKSFIKRYPYLLAIILSLIVLICIAVIIQVFRETNYIAAWIFNFVNDWATSLSATAAVIIIFVAWITFQENRRNEALSRIRNWAKEAVNTLSRIDDGEDLGTQITVVLFEGYAIVREGRWWPELQVEIIKAVQSLETITQTKKGKTSQVFTQAIVNFVTVLESASKL